MPWKETTPMKERINFLKDYHQELLTFTELCNLYNISRKTGYKWLNRFTKEGVQGLADRSRSPRACPHRTDPGSVEAIIELRKTHPSWGARKLIKVLSKQHPDHSWPSPSTAYNYLKKYDLIRKRRRRRRPGHPGRPTTKMDQPNMVWTADFKGQFRTSNRRYCYPLTIMDGYSRFLLACQALPSTAHDGAQPVFKRLFREYGLPNIIRTDNGVPFATIALRRLSRLQVWWIKIGIFPELIEPASPHQNGHHERFHRTLKQDTARPPASNHASQQARFDKFQKEYNHLRPHEALGMETPSIFYKPSTRVYPDPIPEIEYPGHYERRKVNRTGKIRWKGKYIYVTRVLRGEYVGLEEIDVGVWSVYFGNLFLGRMDERELKIVGSHPDNRPI